MLPRLRRYLPLVFPRQGAPSTQGLVVLALAPRQVLPSLSCWGSSWGHCIGDSARRSGKPRERSWVLSQASPSAASAGRDPPRRPPGKNAAEQRWLGSSGPALIHRDFCAGLGGGGWALAGLAEATAAGPPTQQGPFPEAIAAVVPGGAPAWPQRLLRRSFRPGGRQNHSLHQGLAAARSWRPSQNG